MMSSQAVVLLGRGSRIELLPREDWERQLVTIPERHRTVVSFMTGDHHRVRRYVVKELPRTATAIESARIADDLRLPPADVERILDELERRLFFLVRDDSGAVSWAFPVTVERTPHHMRFSTGERLYGA